MASAPHRQNELEAAYTSVGVGVTCADNQACTVEVFGYAYGRLPLGQCPPGRPGRRGRAAGRGRPRWWPAPRPATRSTARARPSGPGGQVTATGGQYPYPYAVAGRAR